MHEGPRTLIKFSLLELHTFELVKNDNKITLLLLMFTVINGLGGSVGCAVRLETRRLWIQPSPRSATFFRGE